MKNIFLGIITTGILVISCKKDEKPTIIKDETQVQQPVAVTNNAPKPSLLDQSGITTTAAPTTVNTSSPAVATPTAATAPGMNPPHGQPGHRCDIPVGQPLNSKPAAAQPAPASAPQAQVNPQPVTAPPVTAANNTGPKPATNPPHGEPWHDCAKQVGAPL